MISVVAGEQGDGVCFALFPLDRVRFKSSVRQVFLSMDPPRNKAEHLADRWLIVTAMLTGLPEEQVAAEGFQIVRPRERAPISEPGEVIPAPDGTTFLRSDV